MSAQETQYYSGGNVLITNACAEFGEKTFAMLNVTSVSVGKVEANSGCAVLLLLAGGLGLFFTLFGLPDTFGGLVLCAVMLGIGILWQQSLKPTYTVTLGSASGEMKALESQNQQEIEPIVAAIKRAIIERG
jgi:hypothetical protein